MTNENTTPQAVSTAELAAALSANTETGTVKAEDLTPISIDDARAAIDAASARKALDEHLDSTQTVDGWTPAFNDTVRTVIYVVCFALGLIGGVLSIIAATAGAPAWAIIASVAIAWIAPQTASAFGVAYNPLRNA